MDNHHKHDEAETTVPLPATQAEPITSEATQNHSVEVTLREAPTDPVILIFDEGDTLFKKRSTVEDSHHRFND